MWFQNALKPHLWIKNNREITDFQNRDEFMRQFLMKWHHQRIASQTQKSAEIQTIKNFSDSFQKYYLRQLRVTFDFWRAQKVNKNRGRDKVIKFVLRSFNDRKHEAFLRWKQLIVHQNYMMRMNSKAVRFSILHYK